MELFCVLAESQNTLLGIAPCCIVKTKRNFITERCLCFLGSQNFASDYADFIVKQNSREVLAVLLEALWSGKELWTVVDLINIRSDSPHLDHVRDFFAKRGAHVTAVELYEAPTRILGDKTEDHKAASKKSLKRHFNFFNKKGELRFEHLEDSEKIIDYLPQLFQQHKDRWDATDTPSMFADDRQQVFYRQFIPALLSSGDLRFSVVLFDSEPLAFHCGFEFRGTYYWYKPTFAQEWSKKSPGEVLIKFLLEHCIENDLKEFDFTCGSERFKYRFANEIRKIYRLEACFSLRSKFAKFTVEKLRYCKRSFQRLWLKQTST